MLRYMELLILFLVLKKLCTVCIVKILPKWLWRTKNVNANKEFG